MYYITTKLSPSYRQLSIEELLFGNPKSTLINSNLTNTRTYTYDKLPIDIVRKTDVYHLIFTLNEFNNRTAWLRDKSLYPNRHALYREFYIPKKSGGLRKIDAPEEELMTALRALKTIFERDFNALYHTSAFAYIKNRCTIDAIKRHQSNNSKWFGKYDLSNFFGSTTLDYVMKMLSMIYPFSLVIEAKDVQNLRTGELMDGEYELRQALELAFLDGGLPQGTPISPLITNIIMIPVDFELANNLRNFNKQSFVYTRYADDFLVSSKYDFSFREIENEIVRVLQKFEAPFTINSKKTRYGSSAGSNWNLGVMLNKDNEITVGHKRKKSLQNMIVNYIMDYKNDISWSLNDVQVMQGNIAYCKMVEPENINGIINHINKKFQVDVMDMIKAQLLTK